MINVAARLIDFPVVGCLSLWLALLIRDHWWELVAGISALLFISLLCLYLHESFWMCLTHFFHSWTRGKKLQKEEEEESFSWPAKLELMEKKLFFWVLSNWIWPLKGSFFWVPRGKFCFSQSSFLCLMRNKWDSYFELTEVSLLLRSQVSQRFPRLGATRL